MAKNEESVSDILADMKKKHDISAGTLNDVVEKVQALDTGNLVINHLTGIGGLPVGRIIELYGKPASGKSSLAIQAAANLQQRIIADGSEEYILYLDYEHAIDRDYMARLGLDVDHPSFIISQPRYLEDGATLALKLIRTGKVRLVIWDSVSVMVPKDEADGEFAQRTAAMNRARVMKALCTALMPPLYENNCSSIFINQQYTSAAMKYGEIAKEGTTGGQSLEYLSTLRLQCTQMKIIKEEVEDPITRENKNQEIATLTMVKVIKNKVAPPKRDALLRINYGRGFDNVWSAFQVLKAHNKVMSKGAGIFLFDERRVPSLIHPDMPTAADGRPTIRGENAVLEFAANHPDWAQAMVKEAKAVLDSLDDNETMNQEFVEDE